MNNLIDENLVLFDVEAETKEDAINIIANAMENAGRLCNKSDYINDVLNREQTASTAIGFNFATPHAKSAGVKVPSLAFVRFKNPIQWDEDSDEVKMAFQIAVPIEGGEQHLEILAKIFRHLIHEDFRNNLKNAQSAEDILSIVKQL